LSSKWIATGDPREERGDLNCGTGDSSPAAEDDEDEILRLSLPPSFKLFSSLDH